MTTSTQFQQYGFIIMRNIIDKTEADTLYSYTLEKMDKGNLDDGQVPGSPSFYQDKKIQELQKKLLPLVEQSLGMKLLPVFCYHRIYRTGAVLRMHKDGTRAELSATINLGQKGEPWDLWLLDYDENPHKVSLQPGDALVYWGHKLFHWRGKLKDADLVAQAMFHCVDAKGAHTFSTKLEYIPKLRRAIRKLCGIAY